MLGLVALRTGEGAEAVLKLHASLEIHCELGDRWRQPSLVDALAAAALDAGDAGRAAGLIGLADRLRDVPPPTLLIDELSL